VYKVIIVPVDLRIMSVIEKSIAVAADLGQHYEASVTLLGVSSTGPNIVASGPKEYAKRLAEYAAAKSKQYGFPFEQWHLASVDPAAELQRRIQEIADELGADLVIMESHRPGLLDYLWPANTTSFVANTPLSVMVVR
jgi:nucleotide-binding universal stress UspA family protein